jgi:ssDNA-binding Zn-finger/Zn-ribbon topoisomerase 1
MALFFDCPLCGKPTEIKQSKKGRPYICCSECQCWIFVNSPSGIEKLKSKATKKAGTKEAWF